MTAWVGDIDWVIGITTDRNGSAVLSIASSGDCTRLGCDSGLGQQNDCKCGRRGGCEGACDRRLWLPIFCARRIVKTFHQLNSAAITQTLNLSIVTLSRVVLSLMPQR